MAVASNKITRHATILKFFGCTFTLGPRVYVPGCKVNRGIYHEFIYMVTLNTPIYVNDIMKLVPSLRAYARFLAKSSSHADDLVQDTLERAWRSRETFRSESNLKGWLFSILRNRFTDEARRFKGIIEDVDGKNAAQLTTLPDQYWRLQYIDLINAINIMSPPVRDALVLVIGLGFTHEEAAVALGCPLGTLKSRVSRAKAQLLDLVDVYTSSAETS